MESKIPWEVLVVDDEEDIHEVTKLALRRKTWRDRPIALAHARSGAEAREIFAKEPGRFQVALVDVVMETDTAGLDLCKYIRAHCPRTLRIVVRTGQPGVAPPDKVLNEHDIDFYLSKPEVTVDRLYSVLRACLRISRDIATISAFGRQTRDLLSALGKVSSLNAVLAFLSDGLQFLELKHQVGLALFPDTDDQLAPPPTGSASIDLARARDAVRRARERGGRDALAAVEGVAGAWVLPFSAVSAGKAVRGGVYVESPEGALAVTTEAELAEDVRAFVENWRAVYGTLPSGKWWKDE